MKINVTAEHIAKGHKRSCVYCPVALAINDAFHAYPTASVTSRNIAFGFYDEENDRTRMVYYDIWKRSKVAQFIHAFDRDGSVAPFSFVIR